MASGRPLECVCGEFSDVLHHQTYERIGAEELDDLIPLCSRCHAMVHDLERRGISGLDVLALRDVRQAMIYEEQLREHRARAAVDRQTLWRGTLSGRLWQASCEVFAERMQFHKADGNPRLEKHRQVITKQLIKIDVKLMNLFGSKTGDRHYEQVLASALALHSIIPERRPREAAMWVIAAENRALRVGNSNVGTSISLGAG